MPFIRISLAGKSPSAQQVTYLQAETTKLMAQILGKRPEVTVVAVESGAASNWSVGGETIKENHGLAQMEAFITAGTNTDQKKAEFIAGAYQMLARVLGSACTPIYVVIIEVNATNWGYDGQTQAARKLSAQSL